MLAVLCWRCCAGGAVLAALCWRCGAVLAVVLCWWCCAGGAVLAVLAVVLVGAAVLWWSIVLVGTWGWCQSWRLRGAPWRGGSGQVHTRGQGGTVTVPRPRHALSCSCGTLTVPRPRHAFSCSCGCRRNMEDFVTWVDTSRIRRAVDKYNEKLDDYDLLN